MKSEGPSLKLRSSSTTRTTLTRRSTWFGVIKEKQDAKNEFDAHSKIGSTVAFAEFKEQDEDILRIELGNFTAGEHLSIKFKYLEQLDLVASQFWRFRIPIAMTPRYNQRDSEVPKLTFPDNGSLFSNNTNLNPSNQTATFEVESDYSWECSVKIVAYSLHNTVLCPSHKQEVSVASIVEDDSRKTRVSLALTSSPQKDFEILINEDSFNFPSVKLARDPTLGVHGIYPQRCAMMHSEEMNHLMEFTKGDYWFIIDRSGSMDGERINIAKKALELAIRSLPSDSYFNIISFGSDFKFLYPESARNTYTNVQDAILKIRQFSADMGGTEILNPLLACLFAPEKQNYSRIIFLLTDGAVSNAKQVISKVQKSCFLNQNRVFTVGIGNGISEQFIKRLARVGGGNFEIIQNLVVLEDKIITLLNSSLSPTLSNIRIKFDPNAIEAISPTFTPKSQILRNSPLQIFAALKNTFVGKTDVTVTYYDSVSKRDLFINFGLDSEKIDDLNTNYHKLLINSLIKEADYGMNPQMLRNQRC